MTIRPALQPIIPSLGLDRDDLTHACVTASSEWGFGVFSWHNCEEDAMWNAQVTGGRVVPVDRVDGDWIVPPLAAATVNRFLTGDEEE